MRTRGRATTAFVAWAVSLTAAVPARQSAPAPQATFRTGVELIQLDVSVLDTARRPVSGLTARDFTVLVDGRERPVAAFKAVDVPPSSPRPAAPWMREIAADVATNIHPSGRVIAILIDDYSFGEAKIGPGGTQKARKTAQSIVDALGADDRAAVLFTGHGHTAQGFTTDRRLLNTAIEESAIFEEADALATSKTGAGPLSGSDQNGFCYCGVCSIEALVSVAQSLRSLPEQRKILMFVSAGSVVQVPTQPVLGPEPECLRRKRDALHDALRSAQLSNVTIQAVDPKGLTLGRFNMNKRLAGAPAAPLGVLEDPDTRRVEFLRTVAESTGGRAIVNNNDIEQQVPALLAESGSYYLLGVEPLATIQDGRFHPIQVKVNRRGVDVRTRNGFYEPTERERRAIAAAADSSSLSLSMASPVPKADIPLDVTAVPVGAEDRQGALAIVLGVRQPIEAASRTDARVEIVDVRASLFNAETGKNVGTRSQQLTVGWNATESSNGYYELLSRMPAAPGRYELRVGITTGDGRTASVYAYTEVPNFARDDLSLSGLVLAATPAPNVAVERDFGNMLPITPTTRRTFRTSDRVTAFLRVYQGTSTFGPVKVISRIVNSSNDVFVEDVQPLEGTPHPSGNAADYRLELPMFDFTPDEYVLTVDVAGGSKTAQRALRFRVQ